MKSVVDFGRSTSVIESVPNDYALSKNNSPKQGKNLRGSFSAISEVPEVEEFREDGRIF